MAINVSEENELPGTVTVMLFMCDSALADQEATLVASAIVTVTSAAAGLVLVMDRENKYEYTEYIEPSMYVTVDCDRSDLTLRDGPKFGVRLGDTVDLVLAKK